MTVTLTALKQLEPNITNVLTKNFASARESFGHEVMFRSMYHAETVASDSALRRRHGESEVNSNGKTYVEITASKERRSYQQRIGCHPATWCTGSLSCNIKIRKQKSRCILDGITPNSSHQTPPNILAESSSVYRENTTDSLNISWYTTRKRCATSFYIFDNVGRYPESCFGNCKMT